MEGRPPAFGDDQPLADVHGDEISMGYFLTRPSNWTTPPTSSDTDAGKKIVTLPSGSDAGWCARHPQVQMAATPSNWYLPVVTNHGQLHVGMMHQQPLAPLCSGVTLFNIWKSNIHNKEMAAKGFNHLVGNAVCYWATVQSNKGHWPGGPT